MAGDLLGDERPANEVAIAAPGFTSHPHNVNMSALIIIVDMSRSFSKVPFILQPLQLICLISGSPWITLPPFNTLGAFGRSRPEIGALVTELVSRSMSPPSTKSNLLPLAWTKLGVEPGSGPKVKQFIEIAESTDYFFVVPWNPISHGLKALQKGARIINQKIHQTTCGGNACIYLSGSRPRHAAHLSTPRLQAHQPIDLVRANSPQ